jgi:hypothetical protein
VQFTAAINKLRSTTGQMPALVSNMSIQDEQNAGSVRIMAQVRGNDRNRSSPGLPDGKFSNQKPN